MRSSSYPPLIDPAKHEKVGEGGFGAVYRISKKTVGKLVPAAPDPGGGLPADANPWREVHIHSRVNRLLDRDPSVRAVRMLSHAFDGRYMHILMESYDGDLGRLLEKGRPGTDRDDLLRSVCVQVVAGYSALCRGIGFFHGDPGEANVLYRSVKRRRETLRVGRETVDFDNAGVRLAVADFGSSLVDGLPLSETERVYYPGKCGAKEVPRDAWEVLHDVAERAWWHPGLAELLYNAVTFRRFDKGIYTVREANPEWGVRETLRALAGPRPQQKKSRK